jgi:hypothetical protein
VLPGGVDGNAVLTFLLGVIGVCILATIVLVCINQWRQAFGRSSGPWLRVDDYAVDKTEIVRRITATELSQGEMKAALMRIDRDLGKLSTDVATTLQAVRADLQAGFTQGFEGRKELSLRITSVATDVAYLKGTLTTRPPHDNS